MGTFSELPLSVQSYINDRFANHGISGREAFNSLHLFPDELKDLPPNDLVNLFEKKHISHIMPKAQYPELSDKIENIVLEDIAPNLERGNAIMTAPEKETALRDLLQDIEDGDINEDGITDLEILLKEADSNDIILDIVGASLPIGLVLSGVQIVDGLKKNEISLNEMPTFFIYKTGERTIKLAVVGSLLATGSPVLVSGTVAYVIYRSRKLLKSMFQGLYRRITSQYTKNFLSGTGKIIVGTGKISGKVLKKSVTTAYDVVTHKHTKTVGKNTIKGLFNISKLAFKGGVNVVKGLGWFGKKFMEGYKGLGNKDRK